MLKCPHSSVWTDASDFHFNNQFLQVAASQRQLPSRQRQTECSRICSLISRVYSLSCGQQFPTCASASPSDPRFFFFTQFSKSEPEFVFTPGSLFYHSPCALIDLISLITLTLFHVFSQAYLTDFLTQFAQQPCYSMFSGHLNNAERQTLQSIGLQPRRLQLQHILFSIYNALKLFYCPITYALMMNLQHTKKKERETWADGPGRGRERGEKRWTCTYP